MNTKAIPFLTVGQTIIFINIFSDLLVKIITGYFDTY